MKKFFFTQAEISQHTETPQSWQNFVRRSEVELVLEHIGQNLGSMLEIGAGNGHQSSYLVEACDNLTSTEIDRDSQAVGNERFDMRSHPRIEYVLWDARDLPFSSGSFDTVYSSNALEHIENVATALEEFSSLLKNPS